MSKKADNELEKFKKVVDLLRHSHKENRMKILVHPAGVELKIEKDAIEEYSKSVEVDPKEVTKLVRSEIARIINMSRGDYDQAPIEILLGPPPDEETEEELKKRVELLKGKIKILKETEEEWNIRRRLKAKLRAKTDVFAETRWEVCRRLADERKTRDSAPFVTLEVRYLQPPFFTPTDTIVRILLPLFSSIPIKTFSIMCDKDDVRYLREELQKVEMELTKLEKKEEG
jgi:hypothetical protein